MSKFVACHQLIALKNLRSSKTILLTTHQMEEADVLSDRIAIMDRGMLQCYGSPAYLRATRGADCKLKIVLASKGEFLTLLSIDFLFYCPLPLVSSTAMSDRTPSF